MNLSFLQFDLLGNATNANNLDFLATGRQIYTDQKGRAAKAVPTSKKSQVSTKFFKIQIELNLTNGNLLKIMDTVNSIASGVTSLLNVSSPHVKKLLNWKQGDEEEKAPGEEHNGERGLHRSGSYHAHHDIFHGCFFQ